MTSGFNSALIPADVLAVCQRLNATGHQAHLVGGGIRDLLLGRTPADFDVATNALPDVVMSLFGARYALPTGLQHGTITVLAGQPVRHVEVTTFRGEGEYLDGRRPSSVSFSATLQEDLARRDFTMNAIAFDPVANLITDPFDGQGDLGRRLVRAVGDPIKRFTEDGLRPMRAIRQATQLGFRIDEPTLKAIPATLASFRMVSGERIRDELFKMFRARQASGGVRLMQQTQLLALVFPELQACVACEQGPEHEMDVFDHSLAVMDMLAPRADLRLAGLLHDVGKPVSKEMTEDGRLCFPNHADCGAKMMPAVADRLRLSGPERRLLIDLTALHDFPYHPSWSDAQLRGLLRRWRVGTDRVADLVAMHVANRRARRGGQPMCQKAESFAHRVEEILQDNPPLAVKDLAIDGRTLMDALQIPPGKRIGQVLEALVDHVIEDPRRNTTQDLLFQAQRILAAAPAD